MWSVYFLVKLFHDHCTTLKQHKLIMEFKIWKSKHHLIWDTTLTLTVSVVLWDDAIWQIETRLSRWHNLWIDAILRHDFQKWWNGIYHNQWPQLLLILISDSWVADCGHVHCGLCHTEKFQIAGLCLSPRPAGSCWSQLLWQYNNLKQCYSKTLQHNTHQWC